MEAVIWIEILSRHREVLARHRCSGPAVRIGRAYDNDVVIDDPHVAPHHLVITRATDGTLMAEDLGSINGLMLDREVQRRTQVTLDGDRPIRIGSTMLRVRDAGQPVAHERALVADTRLWPRLGLLALAIFAAYTVSQWLNESDEAKVSRYATTLLVLPLWAVGWSGTWAIASRIFTGQARFERNLTIGLWGLLVYWLWSRAVEILSFGLSWPSLVAYQEIGLWCLVGAVVFAHLRALGPSRPWLKATGAAAFVGLVIVISLVRQWDSAARSDSQPLMYSVMPPVFRLTGVRDEAAFFSQVERLKAELDRERVADVPGESSSFGLLSDDDD